MAATHGINDHPGSVTRYTKVAAPRPPGSGPCSDPAAEGILATPKPPRRLSGLRRIDWERGSRAYAASRSQASARAIQ